MIRAQKSKSIDSPSVLLFMNRKIKIDIGDGIKADRTNAIRASKSYYHLRKNNSYRANRGEYNNQRRRRWRQNYHQTQKRMNYYDHQREYPSRSSSSRMNCHCSNHNYDQNYSTHHEYLRYYGYNNRRYRQEISQIDVY